ncbi:MAG: hypothetical protein ACR2JO_03860, partial [Mycobacteriales bacterium]
MTSHRYDPAQSPDHRSPGDASTAPWWLSAQEADSAPPPSHPDAGPASAGETIGGAAEAPPGDV